MEELFEVVIVIIGVIAAIAKAAGKTKKIKKNAPGQAKEPVYEEGQSAEGAVQPARTAPRAGAGYAVPAQPTVQPTVRPASPGQPLRPVAAPTAKAAKPASADIPVQPGFWQQLGEALKEELGVDGPQKGHGTVNKMPEGDSRECEHGSIGGSMAYESHQGGRIMEERVVRTAEAPAAKEGKTFRPAMNAEEMRRAVVMAEILKRPQERMAEQARRWSVR